MLKQCVSPSEIETEEPTARSGAVGLLAVVAGLEDKKQDVEDLDQDHEPVKRDLEDNLEDNRKQVVLEEEKEAEILVKKEEEEEEEKEKAEEETTPPSQPATSTPTMTTATTPPPPPPEQPTQQPHGDSAAPVSAGGVTVADPMEAADNDQPETSEELGARLVCPVCDGALASDVALASHIQDLGLNHAGSESGAVDILGFACRLCRRVFASADLLDRHVLSHPGEQVFKCPLCGQALRTNGGLARHARRHLDGLSGHVDLLRQGQAAKRPHSQQTTDETDYEVEAKRRSPSVTGGSDADDDAAGHTSTPSPAPPAPPTPLPPVVQRFTCPVCPTTQPFRAQYLPELEAHLEQSHHDYRVSCELCGGSFRSVRDLNLHVHTVHRSGKAGRGRDVVGFKDLTFVDFSSQKFAHIARAECEKSLHRAASRLHPFQCECGLAFPCDSALAIHRQACPNTVYVDAPADLSRGGVARPQLGGASEQTTPRAASPKGDFFAKLDLLNNASASPNGVLKAPYGDRDLADIQSILTVSAASMGLAVGHTLANPLGAHSLGGHVESEEHEEQQDAFAAEFRRMKQRGEFPCRLCPEVFPNLRALKGHNRTHMAAPGADGYRCNMCPHAALDKVALQRHMRTHNGARPYECALCRFAFTTKANCERHLRNRHAKCSRDEVKSSIIYHPSEDPGNDPEQQRELAQLQQQQQQQHAKLDVKRSLFAEPMPTESLLLDSSHGSEDRRRSLDVGTMTSASEDDTDERMDDHVEDAMMDERPASPLDLSMVLDLSKKRPPTPRSPPAEDAVHEDEEEVIEDDDEQPQDLSRKSTSSSEPGVAIAPVSLQHLNNQSTPMQSPEAAATASAMPFPLYVNPYQLPQPGQGLSQGLPFPAAYYPGLLRSLQLGPLGQVGGLVLEPMRLLQRPPYLPGVVAASGDVTPIPGPTTLATVTTTPSDLKDDICPASPCKSEAESLASQNCQQQLQQQQHSASSGSSCSSSSKMVMKNGVLMPKQKQRRYRTERPHMCDYCSARFTLSSNRERHVKHQHPQYWSQRHRGPTTPANGGPPATPPSTPAPATPIDASTPLHSVHSMDVVSKHEEDDEDEGLVIDEERDHHDDEGVEGDAEDEGHARVPAPQPPPSSAGEDLASVSRLLNNASMQTFRQFLRDGEDQPVAPAPHPATPSAPRETHGPEEGLGSEEDMDEEGLVAGSPSEENNSGSEQDKSESEATAAPPKKKSAYSLAPNRVCCPYCSRKFPWTSSLRRHVLTHTGQKPYKCTYCPLLFTTKSNCDRHLARKHSNKKQDAANNSSSSSGVSSTPNSSTTSVSPGSSASGGSPPELLSVRAASCGLGLPLPQGLRNVPERPYRCRHCPSSTFATLSNLRKHVSTKHTGASLESCIIPGDVSGYESSVSDVEHADDKAALDEDKKAVYSAVEQPISLCKVERNEDVKEDAVLNLRRVSGASGTSGTSESDRDRTDIMREAHNSLMSAASLTAPVPVHVPVVPITAPIVSIPEGTPRPTESSVNLSSSDLPFKCHLCDGSFTERQECLDHIRLNHASEYEVLLSKGALELSVNASPEDNSGAMDGDHHGDGDNIEHVRGKFPDYANRKVMCAFCMRRFWSAEDLRRHMRTHTGERPFSCDVCRRRFTLKHSMLRHRKKHSDISNNNNNSLSAPLVNSNGPEDLSPSATSGDEEGFKHTPSRAELHMHHVKMTNHNNNNINMTGVGKMLMAICDNQVNLKRNFRRKEEEDSGLISNLLGIGDPSIIDKVLLTKSADDAEKLLGVGVFQNGNKSTNGHL